MGDTDALSETVEIEEIEWGAIITRDTFLGDEEKIRLTTRELEELKELL